MAKKRRVEFSFPEHVFRGLDAVAARQGFELAAPYAARTGRRWDWGAAVEYLVQSSPSIDSVLEDAASFFDDFLSEHNGSCSYEDGEMEIRAGGKVYTRKLLED